MLVIKETLENGTVRELSFTDKNEAAEALRTAFGIQKTEAQERQEMRRALNDSLRKEWARGRSSENPAELFAEYRRNL